MFVFNTRQLKVKDILNDDKRKFDTFHYDNDMCDFSLDDNGDLIITVSRTSTAYLHNNEDANQDILEAIEILNVPDNAKVFAKYDEDYDKKIYKVIGFMIDEEQLYEYERAYTALHVVARIQGLCSCKYSGIQQLLVLQDNL